MTLETYINNTLLLSNSLIIKNTDTALAINRGLFEQFGYQAGSKPEQWKYYLNIAGRRHVHDSVVEIKVLETNKVMPLSPELLEQNKYTKEELSKFGEYYKQVIEQYPDYDLFIKGCINPVDIKTAINAKEGTILSYNKNLVEYNEYELIRELEKYIKGFLQRWNVKAYNLTDNLYTASMLAVLYSTLPAKIMNIRLDNVNTNQVHSFHLENFFRSHLELYDNVSILKPETKQWLYRNLLYILKTVGKDSTLKLIIDKVFEANGIGIGEYKIRLLDPVLIENVNDTKEPTYKYEEPVIVSNMLNQSYKVKHGEEFTVETVVAKQIKALGLITDIVTEERDKYIIQQEKNTLSDIIKDNQKTKILDISINQLFKRYSFDLFAVLLDHWIFSVYFDKYVNIIEFDINNKPDYVGNTTVRPMVDFTDPTTNKTYSVTTKVGFLMLIKAILHLTGNLKLKIKSYKLSTVMHPDATNITKLFNKMYKDGYTDVLISKLINHYPVVLKNISLPEEFKIYVERIISYYSYIWTLDSNTESGFISGSIRTLFNYNMYQDTIMLSDLPEGDTIDNILNTYGVNFILEDNVDIVPIIQALIRTFTKVEVDEYIELNTILYHCKELLNKLTSYTTQVITTLDDSKSLPIYYNNIPVLRSKNGLITITKSEWYGLEKEKVKLNGEYYRWVEQTRCATDNVEAPLIAYCNPDIAGLTEIYDLEADGLTPRNTITLSDIYSFNKEYCLGENIYIKDVSGYFYGLEKEKVNFNADYGPYDLDNSQYTSNGAKVNTKLERDYEAHIATYNSSDKIDLTSTHNVTVFTNDTMSVEYNDKYNKWILGTSGYFYGLEKETMKVEIEKVNYQDGVTPWAIEPNSHTAKELSDGETTGIIRKEKDFSLVPNNIITIDKED
ncbi:hypothetical protein ACVWU4_001014 [Campylobacter coli]